MGHSLLCLLGLFLLSTVRHGNTEELGVKITLTADRLTIPAGGSVTLTCDVKNSADFQYDWFREPRFNSNQKIVVAGESKRELVTSDAGIYACRGRKGTNLLTVESDPVIIQETDKPRATLTAGTTIIPVGGSVTLTCSVQSSDGWKYEWFRRTQTTYEGQIRDQQNRDIRVSQGGIYSCRGTRGNPVYYTDRSDDVTIEKTFSGFGCERSSFIVPFIVGLVSGIIVVLLLMCCYRKIKKPCCNSLTQSQSTNQSSASQQTANQNEAQVYSSLLHGDLSVYDSIRGSGNTGSADEYNNVTSGFQLEGLDKRSRHDGTEESSDYNNVNPESASGP
ncbi:uncharacterized protein LOC120741984 [Simochromis diagramma]|uniref:uncharacterized protein LOC120741984 n=1 Tax=Simochromis diagramma TaxID=43689 RepID=UPI001A7E3276|nr:uncharacterized protein LOC120741984 [Simochromis diagramma]